jgi:hypothetical protein
MTDFTFDIPKNDQGSHPSVAKAFADRAPLAEFVRNVYEDFRAVPVEGWIILAIATSLSNLFIAFA